MVGVTRDPTKLRWASRMYMPLGRRVAIIGGGLVGTELAEFLVARQRDVTVLEQGPIIAAEMAHPRRWRVLHELREVGVRLVTGAQILEIGAQQVRFRSEEREGAVPADSVILATGLRPNTATVDSLRSTGIPVVDIGDAKEIGYLEGAIHQGFHAAIGL